MSYYDRSRTPGAEDRRRGVKNALGSQRLAGVEYTPAELDLIERYAAGQITQSQLRDLLLADDGS